MKLTSPFRSSGARARIASRIPTALGSRILIQRMILSWPLPGCAQRCLAIRSGGPVSAIVSEDVLLGPAGEVEQRAGWKEVETGLGKLGAVLAHQALVEFLLQLMEIANVARCIFALRVTELVGTPVARLLLL